MTTYVRYLPGDRRLNLASLAPGDYQLIAELHGEIRRGEPVLLCLMPGGQDGEMFIRKRGDRYFAVHFRGEGHGEHPVTLESPEHQRQKEYWARGAAAAGLRAAIEYPVPGGRLDVAITGGAVATDIEIQRSEITAGVAKRRTTRYAKAGFLPVWFNDGGTRPLWLKEVPALGCNRVPWNEQLPRPRAVTATGLTTIEAVRCTVGAFDHCPDGQPRPCGRFHARHAPWAGLSVDDVAAMIPSGDILPMRGQDGLVYLVSPASMTRHQELTGGLGQWLPGGKTAGKRRLAGPRPSETCRNPVHHPELPGGTGDDTEPRVPLRSDGGEPRGPGIYLAGLCVICGRATVRRGSGGQAQHARCLTA